MPSMTTEPAKPPKMDWKSKALWNIRPNTAGSQVMLAMVVHSAMAM